MDKLNQFLVKYAGSLALANVALFVLALHVGSATAQILHTLAAATFYVVWTGRPQGL
jgi:hypothetical protein